MGQKEKLTALIVFSVVSYMLHLSFCPHYYCGNSNIQSKNIAHLDYGELQKHEHCGKLSWLFSGSLNHIQLYFFVRVSYDQITQKCQF